MLQKEQKELAEKWRVMFLEEMDIKINKALQDLMSYSLQPSRDCLSELKIFFHTVKGTALTLGFKEIGKLGEKYQQYVDGVMDDRSDISTDKIVYDLFMGMAQIYQKIQELKEESHPDTDQAVKSYIEDDQYQNMTKSGRLLIVDDDIVILDYLEKLFTQQGYDVHISSKSTEVMNVIRSSNLDLILLDIMMPGKNGFEVLEQIRSERLDIPIIFLTSQNLPEERIKALKAGADDYITKPFDKDELIARVDRILERTGKGKTHVFIDELTGTYTKKYFRKRAEEEIDKFIKDGRVFSVVFIDIDDFKYINDTYGHLAGDYVLKEFSRILMKNLRESDQLYRFGGDEFLALFPETTAEQAFEVIERIRRIVAQSDFRYKNWETIFVSYSAGIEQISYVDQPIEQILENADVALYAAKKAGRCRTVLSSQVKESLPSFTKAILIAGVESVMNQLIKIRLISQNYNVQVASNSTQAIELGMNIKPSLMIIDLSIPDQGGLEVCRCIKESLETKDTKIIMAIPRMNKDDIIRCFELGADDYVVKPFSLFELEMKIKNLLIEVK